MRERGETSQLLKIFVLMTKNQFEKSVKIIRSDNGSKFTSNPMQAFYKKKGILCENSCVDAPNRMGGSSENIIMS